MAESKTKKYGSVEFEVDSPLGKLEEMFNNLAKVADDPYDEPQRNRLRNDISETLRTFPDYELLRLFLLEREDYWKQRRSREEDKGNEEKADEAYSQVWSTEIFQEEYEDIYERKVAQSIWGKRPTAYGDVEFVNNAQLKKIEELFLKLDGDWIPGIMYTFPDSMVMWKYLQNRADYYWKMHQRKTPDEQKGYIQVSLPAEIKRIECGDQHSLTISMLRKYEKFLASYPDDKVRMEALYAMQTYKTPDGKVINYRANDSLNSIDSTISQLAYHRGRFGQTGYSAWEAAQEAAGLGIHYEHPEFAEMAQNHLVQAIKAFPDKQLLQDFLTARRTHFAYIRDNRDKLTDLYKKMERELPLVLNDDFVCDEEIDATNIAQKELDKIGSINK